MCFKVSFNDPDLILRSVTDDDGVVKHIWVLHEVTTKVEYISRNCWL